MTALSVAAVRLFDGSGAAALVRPPPRVSGERIEAVERGLLPPAGCSGERLDFPGCTILPGLIDTHVHLIFSALETNEAIIEQVGRSEEHTSELQSHLNLVCRLLLEKKKISERRRSRHTSCTH